MNWFPTLIFYFGLLDAGLIMAGGLFVAGCILVGKEWYPIFERVGPALGTVIGSNIGAAVILGVTRHLVG